MKPNATIQHYKFTKGERKRVKAARRNRNIQRQIKRGAL